MFDRTHSHEEFDHVAAYLEHLGMATLTPFLADDQQQAEAEMFPHKADDDDDEVTPKHTS